jgi:hypothetical protein
MVYNNLLDRYFGQSVRSRAPQAKRFRFLTVPETQWLEKMWQKTMFKQIWARLQTLAPPC